MPTPCRPCSQNVTVPKKDWQTLHVEAHKAKILAAQLTALTRQRDDLASQLDTARQQLANLQTTHPDPPQADQKAPLPESALGPVPEPAERSPQLGGEERPSEFGKREASR